MMNLEGPQDSDKQAAHCQALSHRNHPLRFIPLGDSGWESTGYQPQTAKVYIKEMISMIPDSCISHMQASAKFVNLRYLILSK